MGTAEEAVVRCETRARRNHGVIGRRTAIGDGVNQRKIARLVESGRWVRLHTGAYAPAGLPVTWETRLAAAREWAGDDCVFSHRTAGRLLGLEGCDTEHIEMVLPRGVSTPGIVVHRLRGGDRPRTRSVAGFRVTNVDRTILDLFSVLPAAMAEPALEDALRRRLTTLDRLWATARTNSKAGRRGIKNFRKALLLRDHRDGTLQSRMEARLLKILRRAPAPFVATQHGVSVGGQRFRLDFAFPEVKLGIEAQSLKWHLGEVRWKRDMRRDRMLKTNGWTLLYYPWDDIDLRPDDVLNEVLVVRERLRLRLF